MLGYAHPKWYYQFVENSHVYLLAKNTLHHSFLSWVFNFKESCNLIGQQHFSPQLENQNFSRYGTDGEISITILVFTLGFFQEKTNDKIFQKNPKKTIRRAILGPFYPNFSKNEFSWKKAPCHFLNCSTIYRCARNQKKLMSNSSEKCETDGQKVGEKDKQTDNSDFLRPYIGQGSNILNTTLKKKKKSNM